MANATRTTSTDRLRAKLKQSRPIKFERIGFMSQAGELRKIVWSETMPTLAEQWKFGSLLRRNDYNLDDNTNPAQRDVSEGQIKKIADGIRHSDRPYIGNLTVGMHPDPEYIEIEEIDEIAPGVTLVKVTVRDGAPAVWSVDGQHRAIALGRVWDAVKDAVEGDDLVARQYLEQSSVELTLLLEGDPDTLSTIFIKMASTKPISPSLIAVMDKASVQNRLGQYVIKNAKLFENRVTYLSSTSHKKRAAENGVQFEGLYPAAAVRSAAAAIAGVGVRDRSPDAREGHLNMILQKRSAEKGTSGDDLIAEIGTEVVEFLDYAFCHVPGWREIADGSLSVADFRQNYLHSAAAGLHVIANVIAAARIAGVSPYKVVDAVAEIPWQRDALQTAGEVTDGETGNREAVLSHVFFEGSLAKTAWDTRKSRHWASASGATRSGYEAAIAKVLEHIGLEHPELKAISTDETMTELGLMARKRGPGRPRKAEKTETIDQ
jgi:hypothetical protein